MISIFYFFNLKLYRTNAVVKPIDGIIRVKKEEEFESEAEQDDLNIEEAAADNECPVDRTAQLIANLMKLQSDYNDVFFQLQKEKELSAVRLRDHKHSVEALKKNTVELRVLQKENQRLADAVKELHNELNTMQSDLKKENVELRQANKLLQARVKQLQFGASERQKFEEQQHCSNHKTKSKPKKNDEFEVENILDDEFRKGKHYFLVKWKGYDESESSWESKSNLNCPKILQKYFKSIQ